MPKLNEQMTKVVTLAERVRQATADAVHGYDQVMELAKATYAERLGETYAQRAAGQSLRMHMAQLTDDWLFTAWTDRNWLEWVPNDSASTQPLARLGTLTVRGNWDILTVPALVPLIGSRSLLCEVDINSRDVAIAGIQSYITRWLVTIPPGKLCFTFIGPIGLDQNVALFMHLGDYDDQLVSGKTWTETNQIEQRLADLTEYIENITQKYLRNDYKSIEEYNQQAGDVAEPYRILVVYDFPAHFSDAAMRRLISIAQNGPRCGVYAIVVAGMDRPMPHDFNMAELEQYSTLIKWDSKNRVFTWQDDVFSRGTLEMDKPDTDVFDYLIKQVGGAAKQATNVEVPFTRMLKMFGRQVALHPADYPNIPDAPSPDDMSTWWAGNTLTKLVVPLGPAGVNKVQCLDLGSAEAIHALVAGGTGSSKSTLLHTLILGLSMLYSPDEIELYLIDFKEGVEFKTYAENQLPHARVIAVESEREFALSILQGLEDELKRRGDILKNIGAESNLVKYRQNTGKNMPRILLIVDEFQELFNEDDSVSTQSARLLELLQRQGRSCGIHVLLGSQTLAGTYTLSRSIIEQMGTRIALQCNESDSHLILADDNPAARLLTSPSEAIYNAASGRVEGNSNFRVAWLPDTVRSQYLSQVKELAQSRGYHPTQEPIIFEGNAPAMVEKNLELSDLLAGKQQPASARVIRAWLGEPLAIRQSVHAAFSRQSASNLLIVGQNEESAVGMLSVTLVSLLAQSDLVSKSPIVYILDFGTADAPGSGVLAQLADRMPGVIRIGHRQQLQSIVSKVSEEITHRRDETATGNAPCFLLIHGLQRARDLHPDDNARPSVNSEPFREPGLPLVFSAILRDGPEVGIHTLVWCDTVTNLNRSLDHRALREFSMRVVMPMSAEDSSNLIGSPIAAKLGQKRAYFYNDDSGMLLKFRPYGIPTAEWFERFRPAT